MLADIGSPANIDYDHGQDALHRLDERVTAGRATPAMCRTVAVAAMRAGDLLTAVLPTMLAGYRPQLCLRRELRFPPPQGAPKMEDG